MSFLWVALKVVVLLAWLVAVGTALLTAAARTVDDVIRWREARERRPGR